MRRAQHRDLEIHHPGCECAFRPRRPSDGLPLDERADKVRTNMPRHTPKGAGLVLAGCLLAAPETAAAAVHSAALTSDIGVADLERLVAVDLQRCVLETKQGKAAKKRLEAALTKTNAKIEKKAKALRSKVEDLQHKAAMLSQAELQKRQEKLMRTEMQLQQLAQEAQESLAVKESQLMEEIYGNVTAIVKQMALESGIQAVIVRSQSTTLYVNPRLDLTNKVIVAYDKQFK